MELALAITVTTVAAVAATWYKVTRRLDVARSLSSEEPDGKYDLEILHGSADSIIDIVAVHGLGADATSTWTVSTVKKGDVNWLKDFLPNDVPEARILTFGYKLNDSPRNLAQPVLHDHAARLLQKLCSARTGANERRPIIFVGHSFGGLVIKSALVQSSSSTLDQDQHLKSIQLSTIGALFFGTPHQAATYSSFAALMKNLTPLASNKRLLQSLEAQSQSIIFQLEEYKSVESTIETYAFYEVRNKRRHEIGTADSKLAIVIPEQSVVPSYKSDSWFKKIELDRNHMNMVKFKTRIDEDYKTVVSCIRTCVSHASKAEQKWLMFEGGIDDAQNLKLIVETEKPGQVNSIAHRPIDQVERTRLHIEEKKHLEKDLERSESDLGLSHPETLQILKRLAQSYAQIGELKAAEVLFQRLFITTEQQHGARNPTLIPILRDLGDTCQQQRHYAQAERCFRHLLEIQAKLLKPDDPVEVQAIVARNTASLAVLLDLQGKFEEAEGLYQQTLKIREELLGPNDPDTLKTLENLALNYRMRKEYSNATEVYEEVLRRRLETDQFKKSQIMGTAAKLADMFEQMGNKEDAKRIRTDWRAKVQARCKVPPLPRPWAPKRQNES